jgi:hypothetical protein
MTEGDEAIVRLVAQHLLRVLEATTNSASTPRLERLRVAAAFDELAAVV